MALHCGGDCGATWRWRRFPPKQRTTAILPHRTAQPETHHKVDLVSPLVTPLTYEGLIDELIGIRNGSIKVDSSIKGQKDQKDAAQPPPPSQVSGMTSLDQH